MSTNTKTYYAVVLPLSDGGEFVAYSRGGLSIHDTMKRARQARGVLDYPRSRIAKVTITIEPKRSQARRQAK